MYVAHRDEINPKPAWLSCSNGWIDTGQNLVNSEPTIHSLFKKAYPANSTISLGNNSDTSFGLDTIIYANLYTDPISNQPIPCHMDAHTHANSHKNSHKHASTYPSLDCHANFYGYTVVDPFNTNTSF